MPESKRPLKVFLCHAHSDQNAVRELYQHLKNNGVDAWLDKENLLPGHDWAMEIRRAVQEADIVVVCLSKQFNQAGFRQKEVRLALDTAMEQPAGEIFIIPARLEECDNLESLQRWHWVDLFEENGYGVLMRALRARAEKIGASIKLTSVNSTKKAPKLSPTNPVDPNRVPAYIRKLDSDKEALTTPISITSNEHEANIVTSVPKIKSPKIRIEILVAIIGAIATLIAALIGILPQITTLIFNPTRTISVTMLATQTPTTILTILTPNKTQEPKVDQTLLAPFTATSFPTSTSETLATIILHNNANYTVRFYIDNALNWELSRGQSLTVQSALLFGHHQLRVCHPSCSAWKDFFIDKSPFEIQWGK